MHTIDPRDRIPLIQKIAFGMGMAVPIAFVNSVAQLTNLIFNLGLGVSVVLLGIAQMVPRFWDAVTDPLMGHISDKTRSRWGRRRPYIVVGGVLTSLGYVLIWWAPESWPKMVLFGYYLLMSLFFYTATTVFSVPLGALGYEMSRDYHEKTRLFAFGSFFGNLFAIITPWMYKIANLNWFSNEVEGMRYVSLVVGGIILVTTLGAGFICAEKGGVETSHQKQMHFWSSMKATVQDTAFIRVVGVVFMVTVGFNLVNNFANYIMIFYVYAGDRANAATMLGINGTCWAITCLFAVFPMTLSSERLGKVRTVQLFVGLMVGGSLLKIVCYNPHYPWLACIPTVFIAAGMLALYTMGVSMVADVCNNDELKSGYRREGSYSAVYTWWLKLAVSMGFLVSGILLASTGFDDQVVIQRPATLLWMRVWEIGLPSLLCLTAVFLLNGYPITEKRAYEIKAALESRRD